MQVLNHHLLSLLITKLLLMAESIFIMDTFGVKTQHGEAISHQSKEI